MLANDNGNIVNFESILKEKNAKPKPVTKKEERKFVSSLPNNNSKGKEEILEKDDIVFECPCGCQLWYVKEDGLQCQECGDYGSGF